MQILIDIHGSCVSRSVFSQDKTVEVIIGQYFSRNNIVSCMMPPVDIKIPRGELHYRSDYAHRCVDYALNKETIPRLFNSKAEFLAVDFFDFCQHVAVVGHTTCQTYDYTILSAPSFSAIWRGEQIHFLEIPTCLWYSYVDLYWLNIVEKFGNNIILSRLDCCGQYITKNQTVGLLPERVLLFGNEKYNAALAELEQYIIDKYKPYVVDVSKYFIADENYEPDATPVHYEENYYKSAWSIIRHVLHNHPEQRYFSCMPPSVAGELLGRDLPDSDFTKIWQKRKKPFDSFAFLDDIIKWLDEGEILCNRKWLASLYMFFNGIGFESPPAEQVKKISDFTGWLLKNGTANDFQSEVVRALCDKARYFSYAPAELLALFITAFETGDMQWIQMLSCLSVLIPNDPQVAMYRAQYRQASK